MKDIRPLTAGKTVVFESPLSTDEILVRTGTIADGSCFVHALLHATSSSYVEKDYDGRTTEAKKLRRKVSSGVGKSEWYQVGDKNISKVAFQENVNQILNEIYLKLAKPSQKISEMSAEVFLSTISADEQIKEAYSVIFELLPVKEFENNILPKAYSKSEKLTVRESYDIIFEETTKFLKENPLMKKVNHEKLEKIERLFIQMLRKVLKVAEETAFTDYVQTVEEDHIGLESVSLYSDIANRDIYFLDGKTRMPYYTLFTNKNIKKRISIIILWVQDSHFEVVGRLLEKNKIQREFSYDDDLIQRINLFVMDPEKIRKRYPSLVPFLSEKSKEPRKYSSSEEEKEDSS